MKTYFYTDVSPYHPNGLMVRPKHENWPPMSTEGSYAILAARILDLPWPEYLRFCRDKYDAKIISNGGIYPIVLFPDNENTKIFVKILNKYADAAIRAAAVEK